MLALILLALVAALLVGSGAVARVGRGIGRLARRVKAALGSILRGDVRVERWLLLVGVVLAALAWVAQSGIATYTAGGSLSDALLPPWSGELLGRGLLAAALISVFAYLQYAINWRGWEERRRTQDDPAGRQESEALARLAAVVELSDDAIIGRTLDGVITSWNSGAERLYGYKAEEVVGDYGFIRAPPECSNEMLALLEKLRRREGIKTYETVHVDKHGRLIDVALTISQIRDQRGDAIGYST